MFFRSKKGVSEVISTVLMILLVIVAVAAIAAFVQKSVKTTEKNISAGLGCLFEPVTPKSCNVKQNGTNYTTTLSFERAIDSDKSELSDVKYIISYSDKSAELINRSNGVALPSAGGSARDSLLLTKLPISIKLIGSLVSSSGELSSCPSQEFSCNFKPCVNVTRQCSELSVDVCYNTGHICEEIGSVIIRRCISYFDATNQSKCENAQSLLPSERSAPGVCSPQSNNNIDNYIDYADCSGGNFPYSCGNLTYTEEVCN